MKKIAELNGRLKKDYEEISEKYVDVIGHQNPKQRIKHVTQLKEKIIQQEQVCLFCKNIFRMTQNILKRSSWLTLVLVSLMLYIFCCK